MYQKIHKFANFCDLLFPKKSENMKRVRLLYNDNRVKIEKVAYIEAKWSTLR